MANLLYSELKKGIRIIIEKQPYEIIEASLMFRGRGHSVLQTKLKNILTGNIIQKTFHPSDTVEEAEISKFKARFLYSHRGEYFFSEIEDPKKRFKLKEEQIGSLAKFLKKGGEIEAIIFDGKIINIVLPIKVQLKVEQSAPGIKGDRAQSGNKVVVLETGAEILAPLFIDKGDIIEINTEKGEYVRRIGKEK